MNVQDKRSLQKQQLDNADTTARVMVNAARRWTFKNHFSQKISKNDETLVISGD